MSSNQDLEIASEVMVMAIIVSLMLLFVGVGILVLIHVCVVRRAFQIGFGGGAAVERGGSGSGFGSSSLSAEDLDKFPCFDFVVKSRGTSPTDCAVCLENFKAGEKCRLLPMCNHSFHAQCVDSWLLRTPICPICRTSAASSSSKSGSTPISGVVTNRFRGSPSRENDTTSENTTELREAQSQTTDTVHPSRSASADYAGVELRVEA